MKRPVARFPYARVLAFLRTRMLGAVIMPALIGAAWAARSGTVRLLPLLLVLVGLAAAELLDLFGADYALWRARAEGGDQGAGEVILPGNPVVAPSRLKPEHIPRVLLPVALVALAVLVYFTAAVGILVLVFLAAAAVVGGLYVLSPFPYAFLATTILPPLVSGGTSLALTGRTEAAAFWAALPVAWISLAVILGYRALLSGSGRGVRPHGASAQRLRRSALLLGFYCLAGINVASWALLGFLPPVALLALVPWAGCLAWLATILCRGPAGTDPVPATAVGVLMHTLVSATLAVTVWLG